MAIRLTGEMARSAQRLFDNEAPMEKRRLLYFVVSNSTWANGELNATLREPFGFIAEMAKFTSRNERNSEMNFADHSFGWRCSGLRTRLWRELPANREFYREIAIHRYECRREITAWPKYL